MRIRFFSLEQRLGIKQLNINGSPLFDERERKIEAGEDLFIPLAAKTVNHLHSECNRALQRAASAQRPELSLTEGAQAVGSYVI